MTIREPFFEEIKELKNLWSEAFGDTEAFINLFFDSAFSLKRSRAVFVDGKPVSALYWFDCTCRGERIAYIYAVATLGAHRGEGLCTFLMNDTHKHLSSLGYSGAVLVPGEKSLFDFYAKIGYIPATSISELVVSASTEVDIREIDAGEYAEKRRLFLPEGAVIQEGENLKLLSSQAKFYTGDAFLLAARKEGEKLYALEFLGDKSKAPCIVASLGCKEGKFRTVGRERPFAMFIPLRDNITPPTYFAFAFD